MEPPKEIPKDLFNDFTLGGKIPTGAKYFNDTVSKKRIWSKELINNDIKKFTRKNIEEDLVRCGYNSGKLFLEALIKYPLENKSVCVIGSQTPWIECIALNFGASEVTTVEYNVPECLHERIKTISFNDFKKSSDKYDCIISYSSIEHSGLGRYGDDLNPNGDLETMDVIYEKMNSDGILYIGVPIGHDFLAWNAHRIYGKIRLPMLLQKFNTINHIGMTLDELYKQKVGTYFQPIIICDKKKFNV